MRYSPKTGQLVEKEIPHHETIEVNKVSELFRPDLGWDGPAQVWEGSRPEDGKPVRLAIVRMPSRMGTVVFGGDEGLYQAVRLIEEAILDAGARPRVYRLPPGVSYVRGGSSIPMLHAFAEPEVIGECRWSSDYAGVNCLHICHFLVLPDGGAAVVVMREGYGSSEPEFFGPGEWQASDFVSTPGRNGWGQTIQEI